MFRTLITCLLVAALSSYVNSIEHAQGERQADAKRLGRSSWVRTTAGWEHSSVLHSRPAEQATLHPLVVAGLQMMGSVLVLLAFPTTSAQMAHRRVRTAKRVLPRQRTFWPIDH